MRLLAAFLFSGLALTQTHTPIALGASPKARAEDYEAHAKAGTGEIGAEFMVRSNSRGNAMYIATGYVTVEVALYAPKGESVEIRYSDFQLRINGKKQTLLAQNPYIVAPAAAQSVGAKGVRYSLGGPPENNAPPIPQVPKPDPPDGIDRQPTKTADEIAVEAALPEGNNRTPVSGFLYFGYTGRNKSIQQVELLYRDTVLKLR